MAITSKTFDVFSWKSWRRDSARALWIYCQVGPDRMFFFHLPRHWQLDVILIWMELSFFKTFNRICCGAGDRDGKTATVVGLDGDYLT